MIVSEHVQSPVDHETQEFFTRRYALPPRVVARHLRADIDVTNYRVALTLPPEAE